MIEFLLDLSWADIISFSITAMSLLIALAIYIFRSIGLYALAHRRNISGAWLAWLPVLHGYVLGKLADCANMKNRAKKTHNAVTLPILYVLTFLCSGILLTEYLTGYGSLAGSVALDGISMIIIALLLVVMLVLVTVFYVLRYIALYRVYDDYSPNSAVVFTVLGIFFEVLTPFFVFAIRKKTPRPIFQQ